MSAKIDHRRCRTGPDFFGRRDKTGSEGEPQDDREILNSVDGTEDLARIARRIGFSPREVETIEKIYRPTRKRGEAQRGASRESISTRIEKSS